MVAPHQTEKTRRSERRTDSKPATRPASAADRVADRPLLFQRHVNLLARTGLIEFGRWCAERHRRRLRQDPCSCAARPHTQIQGSGSECPRRRPNQRSALHPSNAAAHPGQLSPAGPDIRCSRDLYCLGELPLLCLQFTFELSPLLQGCFAEVCSLAPLDLSFCFWDESDGDEGSEEFDGSFDIEPCGVAEGELVD